MYSEAGSKSVRAGLNEFVRESAVDLPHPGEGRTRQRFQVLADWSARNLSLGRLVEGHADALSILAEAGLPPHGVFSSYGVWAARAGHGGTVVTPTSGGWRLSGVKPYCSGSDQIDRALVTADTPDGYRLFDISVAEHVVAVAAESWKAVGMADSESETLTFGGPVLSESKAVGGPDFYLRRPGFWSGSVGVAACWYGGAKGLVDGLLGALGPEPGEHALADAGRAVAIVAGLAAYLEHAADAIDADPSDEQHRGHRRALSVRQVVHDGCLQVHALVAAAGGAGPLCHDRAQARRGRPLRLPGPAPWRGGCRCARSDRPGGARMGLIIDADRLSTSEVAWTASPASTGCQQTGEWARTCRPVSTFRLQTRPLRADPEDAMVLPLHLVHRFLRSYEVHVLGRGGS